MKKVGSILLHLNSGQKNTFSISIFKIIIYILSQEILFRLKTVLTFRDVISLKRERQS